MRPPRPVPNLDDARTVLAAQAFSVLLGAEVADFGGGQATLVLPLTTSLMQQDGFVHGGVLAYLADNAITFAGGSVLGPRVLTASVSIDYLRPATGDLEASARVIARTGRSAVCQCEITVGGTVCAVAHGTVRSVAGV